MGYLRVCGDLDCRCAVARRERRPGVKGNNRPKKSSPEAAFLSDAESVLLGDLALAQFVQRLTVDTQRGSRSCFQALQADLHSAAIAVAVFADVDLSNRLF